MTDINDVPTAELCGLDVHRVLPRADRHRIGPILHFDHLGPVDLPAGEGLDLRPHPHIGLSTLSYLLEGALEHRDSLGHTQRLDAGGVNWMRAGRGIVHSERTPPDLRTSGHRLHLLQCWIAATEAGEDAEAAFTHWPAAEVPRVLAPGIDLRLVAGSGFDRELPMPGESPCAIAVLRLANRMRFEFRAEYPERGVYVMSGRVAIDGQAAGPHAFATLDQTRTVFVDALEPSVLTLLAGEPIAERKHWWNFVARDASRIEAAKRAWLAGAFPAVPGDDEKIPLPAAE